MSFNSVNNFGQVNAPLLNTGYCRCSVVLGTKSALKHNIFCKYTFVFVSDPIGNDAKNTLASKK